MGSHTRTPRVGGGGLHGHPPLLLSLQRPQAGLRGGPGKAFAQELHGTKGGLAWALESINYGQKITEPGVWGSGTPARTDLPPKGANQAGGRGLPRSSEERPGGSRWRWSPGHKRKIRKQSLTVTWAEPEGLGPGWSPQDCSAGEGALITAVGVRGLGFPLSCVILLPTTGPCQGLQPGPWVSMCGGGAANVCPHA